MNNLSYVCFDVETTGLYPDQGHKIVEIAGLRFSPDGTELETFESLVDPECIIPPELTAIHGIDNTMTDGKPNIEAVLPRFMEFIGSPFDTILIAHNAKFDVGFINYNLRNGFMLSQNYIAHEVICTYELAKRKLGRRTQNHKLGTVASYLNVPIDVQHRALADVRLVKGIFLALRNGY